MTLLPAGRFDRARWLIAAALVLLIGIVVIEMQGTLALARAAEDEARSTADAVAALAAQAAASGRPVRPPAGAGLALVDAARVVSGEGPVGPAEPAFWPWPTRSAWEEAGGAVAGPTPLGDRDVLVAYRALPDGRAVRAVVPLVSAPLLARWRLAGGGLALLAAAGGGLAALLLLGRLLAPYRELLSEAARVGGRAGAEGEDAFLVGTFRATIERLAASEAELRRRADDLEVLSGVLTRGSEAGVIVTGASGAVRAANDEALRLAGGALPAGGRLPDALAAAPAQSRLVLDGRSVDVRRLPLRQSSGAVQGEVLFLADSTRLDALERALAEREQMAALGELAAGMAHELRNALATITGYLRLLGDASGDRRERYLAAIEQEAGAITALLDRFLSFAQPAELRREAVDLAALAAAAADRLRASEPGIALEVAAAPAPVCGDRLALVSVVENLVRNAVEAARSRVLVTVEPGSETARMVVEDDGPGVAPEVRARLFMPFVSTKPSGGLGLALARRLARLHGGDVALEERAGAGARFVLTLPAAEAP